MSIQLSKSSSPLSPATTATLGNVSRQGSVSSGSTASPWQDVNHLRVTSQPHVDKMEDEYTLIPQETQDLSRDHSVSPEDMGPWTNGLVTDGHPVNDEMDVPDDPANIVHHSVAPEKPFPSEGLYPKFVSQESFPKPETNLQDLVTLIQNNPSLLPLLQQLLAGSLKSNSLPGIEPGIVFGSPHVSPTLQHVSSESSEEDIVPVYPQVSNFSGAYVGSVEPGLYDKASPVSIDGATPSSIGDVSVYSGATADSNTTSNYSEHGITNRMSHMEMGGRRKARKSRTTSPADTDSTTHFGSSWDSKGHFHHDDVEYHCPLKNCNKKFRCASRHIHYSAELQRLVYTDTGDEVNDRDCMFLTHLFEDHEDQLSRKEYNPKTNKEEKTWKCALCEYKSKKCNVEAHMLSAGTGHHPAKHFICHTCLHPTSGESQAVYLYNSQSAVHHFGDKHGSTFLKKGPGRTSGNSRKVAAVYKVDACVQQNAPEKRSTRSTKPPVNAMGRSVASSSLKSKKIPDGRRHYSTETMPTPTSASFKTTPTATPSATPSPVPLQFPTTVNLLQLAGAQLVTLGNRATSENQIDDVPEDFLIKKANFHGPVEELSQESFADVYSDEEPDYSDPALDKVITKENAADYNIEIWNDEQLVPTPTLKPTPTKTTTVPSPTSDGLDALTQNLSDLLLTNLPQVLSSNQGKGFLSGIRELLKSGLGMVDEIEQGLGAKPTPSEQDLNAKITL